MSAWIAIWWVWIVLALVLAIIEVLAPGFIFLGIAIGAALVGLMILVLPETMSGLTPNAMLALFGGLSLLSWIVLKMLFRRQSSGAKIVTRDVNDN